MDVHALQLLAMQVNRSIDWVVRNHRQGLAGDSLQTLDKQIAVERENINGICFYFSNPAINQKGRTITKVPSMLSPSPVMIARFSSFE